MVAILGANSVSGGYEISNSLRFNDDDSPFLQFTPSGDGNKRTFTYSVWFKRANLTGAEQYLLEVNESADDNDNFRIIITSAEKLTIQDTESNSSNLDLRLDQVFRDVSAWYHLVVSIDTTQSTNTNRAKVYVNGNQVTSFSTSNYPSQNYDTNVNTASEPFAIAKRNSGGSASHFDGYMTEINFVDGSQLTPTSFGEFDDNGVWIPKKYTGSYGTNGFFLQFKQTGTSQNSSGIGADTSGQDNHFAVTNLAATDITEDTCTNNFCTWNPLNTAVGGFYTNTLLQGNLQCSSGGFGATFDMPSGKWYWEVRCNSSDADQAVGAMSVTESGQTSLAGDSNPTHGFIYQANGNARRNGTVEETWSTFTNGDIIGFSYDADNRILKGYKNNSLAGDITLTDSGDSYTPTVTALGGNFIANFGQEGSFAGTVTAQGNSDGKYGNFYYTPPSGYYALCTKRLAEFG